MYKSNEEFCLLDYVSIPAKLQTANGIYRVKAIYPVCPSECIVELVYKKPLTHGSAEILHKYHYNGACCRAEYGPGLHLVEEQESTEPGVDITLNAFLWLGE